jgi:hypothetical protein
VSSVTFVGSLLRCCSRVEAGRVMELQLKDVPLASTGDGICPRCELRLGLRELYYYGMCERCYYFGGDRA